MAVKKLSPKRVLRVTDRDGEFKTEVPEGGMATFGPALPGPSKGYGERTAEYALRIYGSGGKTDLVAVFTGVRWFRDEAIPLSRAVLKESGKTLWKSDEKGYEVSTSVQKEHAWGELPAKLEGF